MGVSNQTTGDLLRTLRESADTPAPAADQDGAGHPPVPGSGAASTARDGDTASAAYADAGLAPTVPAVLTTGGNGHAGRPAALLPAGPVPQDDWQDRTGVGRDA